MVKKEYIYDVARLKSSTRWIGTPSQFFYKDLVKV